MSAPGKDTRLQEFNHRERERLKKKKNFAARHFSARHSSSGHQDKTRTVGVWVQKMQNNDNTFYVRRGGCN